MRALLAALLLMTAALAGCADGGGDGEESDNGTSSSGTSSGTGTGSTTRSGTNTGSATGTSTGTRQDRPPTGAINVAVNATVATFQLNGSDPDGDAISWTLALGDGASENGTGLPALVNHTYAVGNHTANFTVSAGGKSASYSVNVTITAGGGAKRTQEITGTAAIPNPAGNDVACLRDDIDGNIYALDPAGPGWTYVLEPGDGSFGAYFWDGDTFKGGGTGGTGTVPDGAGSVEVCNIDGAPMTDYRLVLTEP